MNHLAQLLSPSSVVVDCPAGDKAAVLDAVAALAATACPVPAAGIRAGLAAREAMGSTAIGHGVAVPHGRLRGVRDAVAVVLRLAQPVPFDAADGRPVRLFVGIVVPEQADGQHLAVLAQIGQMFSDPAVRAALEAADDAPSLHARLCTWEPPRSAA